MTRFLSTLVRWFATWAWLTLAIACGGASGAPGVAREGANAGAGDDSLAARAVAANAREQGAGTTRARTRRPEASAPSAGATSSAFGPSVGFRSRQRLDEHYAKHGAEFGSIGKEEYLRQAQALRDAPVGGDVLEIRRGDGTVSRFDRGSGAFLAFDDDGTIRTFFKPNDGERYFQRQARRRASR